MRGQRGQSAVEFALTLPVLILLVLGIVDFGRVFIAANALTHGTREAVRYGTLQSNANVNTVDTGIRNTLVSEAARSSVTVDLSASPNPVTITYLDPNAADCATVSRPTPCALGTDTGSGYVAETTFCPRASGCAGPLVGDLVQVAVAVPWRAQTTIIQSVLPANFMINATSAGTIEQ